jgi:hypothetical protein
MNVTGELAQQPFLNALFSENFQENRKANGTRKDWLCDFPH